MEMQNQNEVAESGLLPLGTQVSVSNGQPRPPERFNKKLSKWKSENYEGVIVRFQYGGYTVHGKPADGWSPKSIFIILHSGTPPHKVTAIPGACLAPLKHDGYEKSLDVPALMELEASTAELSNAA